MKGGDVMSKRFPLIINQHPEEKWTVPWEVAEEAYKEYVRRYGRCQTLERIAERGGFGYDEIAVLLFDRIKHLIGDACGG